MKKLVFVAIAAMVMVTVSNVFASNKAASVSFVAPGDTIATGDTIVPGDTVALTESIDTTVVPDQPVDTTTTDTTVAQ